MDIFVMGNCLLIVVARILDVSLGTLRTVFIVRGKRLYAFGLGFLEILIWVSVILKIINHLNSPFYILSYALGFGLGNYLGVTLEQWMALGEQVVRVFTRRGTLAEELRGEDYVVTEFQGKGRDGAVFLLYIQLPRREVKELLHSIKSKDENVFWVVDDIRSHSQLFPGDYPTGWAALAKKK